jgi:nucleoside-specific outer membrane channel protein Tsx
MLCAMPPGQLAADQGFIQWHTTNIQLLRGHGYELGSPHRTIATFEHANGWTYGDFFMFIDQSWPDSGDQRYYSEFSPRLSLSKISKQHMSLGIIEDVLISTTFEKTKHSKFNRLYGIAVNLDLPEFTFFTANLYQRDNPNHNGKTWQVTLAWQRFFHVWSTEWVTEGFADFAGREGNSHANQLLAPRLLMDIGKMTGLKAHKLWLGIEWQYWHHKFGLENKTESVPQLQLKWVL